MKTTLGLAMALVLTLAGCSGVYYSTMEALGKPKRQLLVSRVENARDSQVLAKEQFKSALEQFGTVVNFQGGELEEKYRQLSAEYEDSEAAAEQVRSRIRQVKDVAEALFREWRNELEEYSNDQLRRVSEQKLQETRDAYTQMIQRMDMASAKMDPVLRSLHDQVLFLKHNLNAQAVVSLREELIWVESNTEALVREMEAAIAEANAFVATMGRE